MSILRVDKILSYLEEEEVHVLGLRVGDFPIEMDTDTEAFVKNGTCVYQDDKFKFKQNNEWITIGDEIFSLDLRTDGGGVITVSSEDSISISSGSSAIHTYATLDPSGTPKIGIAWKAGLHQLTVDSPGDPPSGHPGNVRDDLAPNPGDIFQWNPDGAAPGVGHWDALGAGPLSPALGDILAWNGTNWIASGVGPSAGDVLHWDGASWTSMPLPSGLADNLGNHIATENLQMSGHWISNDGGDEGIFVTDEGNVKIDGPAFRGHLMLGSGKRLSFAPDLSVDVDFDAPHITTHHLAPSTLEIKSDKGRIYVDEDGKVGFGLDGVELTTGRVEGDGIVNIQNNALTGPDIGLYIYTDDSPDFNNKLLKCVSDGDTVAEIRGSGLLILENGIIVGSGHGSRNKTAVHMNGAGGVDASSFSASGGVTEVVIYRSHLDDARSFQALVSVADKSTNVMSAGPPEYMTTTVTVMHTGTYPVHSTAMAFHTEHGVMTARAHSSPWAMMNGFTIHSNVVSNHVELSIEINGAGDTFEGTAVVMSAQSWPVEP